MINFNDLEFRKRLKEACAFFGGITAVAQKSGLDAGNLSRWFKGKASYSNDRVSLALNVLGLPDGVPDATYVHSWKIQRVFLKDYTAALRCYFPGVAQICRAPWVVPSPSWKESYNYGEGHDTLYGITDGNIRAVLSMPRSLLIQKENIKGILNWKNGTQENSVLDIPEEKYIWKTGVPNIAEFDRAWGDQAPSLSIDDVNEAIQAKGVTFEQAITAINAILMPRKKS